MKQTGYSLLSELWEHIFPPQIFQVLLAVLHKSFLLQYTNPSSLQPEAARNPLYPRGLAVLHKSFLLAQILPPAVHKSFLLTARSD